MVIFIIGVLIISIVISYYSKKEIVYLVPMSFFSTIIILYTFSILNLMTAGIYFIYALGIASLAAFFYTAIRHKKEFFKSISYTPIVVFIAFALLTLWAHNGRMISLWDELSHWGRIVKDMYYNNALGSHPDSMVLFENYPPGIAMLQYLFVKIRGTFVEEELYYASNMIYFAMMMPLFRGLKKNNVFKIIIIALTVLLLPIGFYKTAFVSLYVDALLGMLFGYILLTYFTNKFSIFTLINISLALFVLTITKNSGVGIAVIALCVIFVDFLFADRLKLKENFKKNNIIQVIICLMLPIVLVAVSKLSWNFYLNTSNAAISFDTSKITLSQIINVLGRLNGTDAQFETMFNFLDAFMGTKPYAAFAYFNFDIAPVTMIVLFAFIGIILFYRQDNKTTKKRIVLAGVTLFIGIGLYFFTLLCSYLFVFTEYEAVGLASYQRYISTYFLGVFIFIVGYIINLNKDKVYAGKKVPLYLMIFFVLLSVTKLEPFLTETILAPFSTYKTVTNRSEYESISKIKGVLDKEDKVYFIDIASNGYSYFVCDYISYPVRLNGLGSIGIDQYYQGDIWTAIIAPEEWKEILLEEYDYVYVYSAEYDFGDHYGYLFGGAENISPVTLYYVDKTESDVILKRVSE